MMTFDYELNQYVDIYLQCTHAYLPNTKRFLCGKHLQHNLPCTRIRTKNEGRVRSRIKYVTCPDCMETLDFIEARIEWDQQ